MSQQAVRIATYAALLLGVGLSPGVQAEPANPSPREHCEQLLQRLERIAQHWKQQPQPSVPRSGRTPEAVLRAASPDQIATGEQELRALVQTRGAERLAALQKWNQARVHTELDVWLVAMRAEDLGVRNRAQALVLHELSLDIGELQGRGDVLGWSANSVMALCSLWARPQQMLPIVAVWARLPRADLGERQAAQLASNYARRLAALGQNEQAIGQYGVARTLFGHAADKLGEGNAWLGEAEVRFLLGQNEAALSAYQKARGLYEQMGSKLGEGNAWLGEADVALSLRQFQAAEANARRAISLARATQALGSEIGARVILMRTLAASGDDQRAIQEAEALLPLASRWRAMGLADWDRTHFAEQVTAPYDVLVPRLAQSADSAQKARALRYAEEAHAPVLRDLFRAGGRRASQTPSPQLRQKQLTIQRRQAELGRHMEQVGDVAAKAKLEQERIALEAELESVQFDSLAAQGGAFLTGEPLPEQQLKSLTRDHGPILLYYAAENELVGFLLVAGQAEPVIHRIAFPRRNLRQTVNQLRYQLANYALWEKQSLRLRRELGDKLLAPFLPALGDGSHLVIIPHGPLHQLPFETLMPNGKPLPLALSMAPSLSALSELASRRRGLGPSPVAPPLVALAAGRGLRLPDREMDQIAALFGSNRASSYQAETDISSYRQLAPTARHLLVISHGVQREGSRLGTYLEIKADGAHDGRLSAAEIAELPLKAELVTLAACDTAHAEALLSDERLDLTRAFLIAGAASVLATRWKVPDSEETTGFLVDFYTGLRQGENGKPLRKDQALQRARERAIQNKVSAQVWAAWVLIGDGE